jgi:5'-nucleotidase
LGGIPEINIKSEGSGFNMEKAPDLVLSGINTGANLGTDIIYSGTAAAARQGSIFGIPSVALSLVSNDNPWQWEAVISYIVENLKCFMSYWKKGAFVNINFPNIKEKPAAIVNVPPCIRKYNDRMVTFNAPDGSAYCFADIGKIDGPEDGTDWAEVLKNNAALSIIMSQPAVM